MTCFNATNKELIGLLTEAKLALTEAEAYLRKVTGCWPWDTRKGADNNAMIHTAVDLAQKRVAYVHTILSLRQSRR